MFCNHFTGTGNIHKQDYSLQLISNEFCNCLIRIGWFESSLDVDHFKNWFTVSIFTTVLMYHPTILSAAAQSLHLISRFLIWQNIHLLWDRRIHSVQIEWNI